MTKLDETGLEAAYEKARSIDWVPDDETRSEREGTMRQLSDILTAYLAASRTSNALRDLQRLGQECEGDRIAVVRNAKDSACMEIYGPMDESKWAFLEGKCYAKGPFRRQIVTIPGGLLRPEPVGEISGTTEPA